MAINVGAHELADDLRRRSVLSPAGLEKPVAQIALNPYA